MAQATRSPSELRSMFGANLRILARAYPSISALSRQLGVNRTQFNRYLAGESFPRPDVLSRICTFFGVDARILLEPVADIQSDDTVLAGPFLRDFTGAGVRDVPETTFPSGFYRFSRRSFIDTENFVIGIIYVFRDGPTTYLRGYEPRTAMAQQGLPPISSAREFRGLVMQQDDGIAMLISRLRGLTCSFNYLEREASFDSNFWVGYATRTVRESLSSFRAERMVYEHLGAAWHQARTAAKTVGYCTLDDLHPFHRRLLRPSEAFR